MTPPINGIMADADEVYRQGFTALLQQQPDFLLLAVADTEATLLHQVKKTTTRPCIY